MDFRCLAVWLVGWFGFSSRLSSRRVPLSRRRLGYVLYDCLASCGCFFPLVNAFRFRLIEETFEYGRTVERMNVHFVRTPKPAGKGVGATATNHARDFTAHKLSPSASHRNYASCVCVVFALHYAIMTMSAYRFVNGFTARI